MTEKKRTFHGEVVDNGPKGWSVRVPRKVAREILKDRPRWTILRVRRGIAVRCTLAYELEEVAP